MHEIKRIHTPTRVTVIPVVIGALGIISKNAKSWSGGGGGGGGGGGSLPDIFG